MKELLSCVKKNNRIAKDIYEIVLTLPEYVETKPGQFANLSVGEGRYLLKRPLGIMKAEGRDITLCYQLKGEGTKILSCKKQGDELPMLLPLGNGFDITEDDKNIVLIGGGVGIFPLISVLRGYKGKNFYSYIGYRDKEHLCCVDDLELSRYLTIVTDDGSVGQQGNAVDAYLADAKELDADLIISCGPLPMFKALKAGLEKYGISTKCLVSLEERMGCGIGACLVCAVKMTDGRVLRVCKDGPVFDIKDVEL